MLENWDKVATKVKIIRFACFRMDYGRYLQFNSIEGSLVDLMVKFTAAEHASPINTINPSAQDSDIIFMKTKICLVGAIHGIWGGECWREVDVNIKIHESFCYFARKIANG